MRRSDVLVLMLEIARLTESTEWINLDFVGRERTPREIIENGIRHHLAKLSPSNTVILLEKLGVSRSRVAVHNWVQKADLQPADGESLDRVAVDQKAIRINDEQYWLYAAVDPQTNKFLYSRLFPTYTIPIAREFLTELAQKHDVEDAMFLVDNADDLIGGLRRKNYTYRVQQHRFRNSVEHIFREVERRTSSFSNYFSHVDPPTAETWLRAHAVWWNYA
jgi:putative transposase